MSGPTPPQTHRLLKAPCGGIYAKCRAVIGRHKKASFVVRHKASRDGAELMKRLPRVKTARDEGEQVVAGIEFRKTVAGTFRDGRHRMRPLLELVDGCPIRPIPEICPHDSSPFAQ